MSGAGGLRWGRFCLGVDTGGTFTDAVVVDLGSDRVVASAKVPTRHDDLRGCVAEAMARVLQDGRGASASALSAADIGLVAVSTTLATNALVEGAGRPAALVAIGFEPETLARAGLRASVGTPSSARADALPATSGRQTARDGTSAVGNGRSRLAGSLASAPVVMVEGGHSAHGNERGPLDVDELTRALERIDASVEAYAVAGQFSVRNAAHELRARDVIREHSGKPTTCSHELSPRLGGPRRAVTTLLNAQLISLTAHFTDAIRAAMESLALDAPLMVVRGDGSLVSADFVTQRPIETVLSGPAASVIGARHLAAKTETLDAGCLVVDIGGTTTDIAAIRDGAVAAAGDPGDAGTATVGGHATMVAALPTVTVGLGGDSEIRIPPDGGRGELAVGPRRVVPLCVAARRHPHVVIPMLRRQMEAERPLSEFGQLLLRIGPPSMPQDHLAGDDIGHEVSRLVDDAGGALPLDALKRSARWRSAVERLEHRGIVRRAAMTPTDACLVLGLLDDTAVGSAMGDAAAAEAGAELFARQRDRYGVEIGADAAELSQRIMQIALRSTAEALLSAALGADGIAPAETRRQLAQTALDRRRRELNSITSLSVGHEHPPAESHSEPAAQAADEGREQQRSAVDAAASELNDSGAVSFDPLWGLLDPGSLSSVAIADAAAQASDPPPLARLDIGVSSPIIAIGAPAATYAPRIGSLLGTAAVVPPHAEVANAVGAAVARVRIAKQITITAPRRGSYRAHWGDDPPIWHSLDDARDWATTQATEAARAEAAAAGAPKPAITVDWTARTAPGNGRELFVEATLRVTATGRPA